MFHTLLKSSPQAALKVLKEKPQDDYHAKDENKKVDTTALQLCAENGYIEIMLRLLYDTNVQINYAKNKKSPLYFAIKYKQSLAAQILLIFGADKKQAIQLAEQLDDKISARALTKLSIDRDVMAGVLIWIAAFSSNAKIPESLMALFYRPYPQERNQVQSENTPLLSQPSDFVVVEMTKSTTLQQPESDLVAGLIRFAAFKKQFQFAKSLAKLDHHSTSQSALSQSALTYEYWAAKAEEEKNLFLDQKDDKQIIKSLKQLILEPDAFEFLHSHYVKTVHLPDLIEEEKHSKDERYLKIIRSNHTYLLKKLENQEINQSIFEKIVAEYDLVAFSTLTNAIGAKKIFEYCLATKNRSLFFITMFLNNDYFYELLKLLPEKLDDITQLTKMNESSGLMHRMFTQALSEKTDLRTPEEIKLQQEFFKKMEIDAHQFVNTYFEYKGSRIVNDRTFQEVNRFGLELTKHATVISIISAMIEQHDTIKTVSLCKQTLFVKNGPVRTIRSYLNNTDNRKLSQTCHALSSDENKKSFLPLFLFLHKINSKIDNIGYFSFRNYGFNTCVAKAMLIHGVTTILTIAPVFYYTVPGMKENFRIRNQLEDNHCVDKNRQGEYNYSHCHSDLSDICATLCEDYNDLELYLEIYGLVFALINLIGCVASLPDSVKKIRQAFLQGKDRVDELTLRQFAPELEREALIIFNMIREPLTMDSTIATIRMVVTQEIARRKEQQLAEKEEKSAIVLRA